MHALDRFPPPAASHDLAHAVATAARQAVPRPAAAAVRPSAPAGVGGASREPDWRGALRRSAAAHRDVPRGSVVTVVSPQGIEFSLLAGPAQTLSAEPVADTPPSLWIALLIDGRFVLEGASAGEPASVELMPGDLLYGPTGQAGTLALPLDFSFLYVRIPSQLLHPRLLDLRALRVAALPGAHGVNRVFAGMLRGVAETMETLAAEQLRPIETALVEFVVASLWEGAALRRLGSARAGHFQRICEALEARLGDCQLSLQGFAADQHASPRYIQKLFCEAGFSFSGYLRQRRLERCRSDLASRTHEALSISEICFRWGFNDAAHFSRSFRVQFGTTPRGFRQGG